MATHTLCRNGTEWLGSLRGGQQETQRWCYSMLKVPRSNLIALLTLHSFPHFCAEVLGILLL